MIREIAICAMLAVAGTAMAEQPKVSGGDTPPAKPAQPQAVPDDKGAGAASAANRGKAARDALKALHGGDPPKPATPPANPANR